MVDDFIRIILIAFIKYATGLNIFNILAHSGMLSVGVNKPLIIIKTNKKKNVINATCCCEFAVVDTYNAIPITQNK